VEPFCTLRQQPAGEICFVGKDGVTDFSALQAAMKAKKTTGLIYFAFDFLWLLSWHHSLGRHRSRATDARKNLRIGWDVRVLAAL
jgi:hypothetical protein